ncbi:hypothetical protein SAMN05216474_0312 [Lishizhenia tianjinensis]|uniref:Histidine kinase n=1 Tax=Lishizhenia tianjinensis TaxID=477690 RepID=A0A1I6XMR1_9FLAO|nr:hypothetical protein [Lishizhenia tianjinensis]SFT39423.1 hypothetical protein SAMN05216474_0312 [Lishizhenia tianjinensis]
MDLQKIRIFVITLAAALAILNLTVLMNFNNLSWDENKSSYLMLISNVAVIIGVLSSYFYERKKLNQ